MATKVEERTYEDAVQYLRDHGFDLIEAPGTPGRVFVRKYNVSAAIQKDGPKDFRLPGYHRRRISSSTRSQVLKTSKTEVAATADHLKSLQEFSEELKEALGLPSLYNESLGTVSEAYQYDRIVDRDKPVPDRPKRPWEKVKAATASKRSRA